MRECLGCETYAKYTHTRTLRVHLMPVAAARFSPSVFVQPHVSPWLQCRSRSCACVVACFARLRSARHGSRVLPVPGLYMGFCAPLRSTVVPQPRPTDHPPRTRSTLAKCRGGSSRCSPLRSIETVFETLFEILCWFQ